MKFEKLNDAKIKIIVSIHDMEEEYEKLPFLWATSFSTRAFCYQVAVAKGINSVSLGEGSISLGKDSLAIGTYAVAQGDNSISIYNRKNISDLENKWKKKHVSDWDNIYSELITVHYNDIKEYLS